MNALVSENEEPWYHEGLHFECTRCGHCCTGEPGYVWMNDDEMIAIAEHLAIGVDEFVARFTKVGVRGRSLREKGAGDCIFYEGGVGCTIYDVRPQQCRTWPFWETNLESKKSWKQAGRGCPGIDQGDLIPVDEITRRLKVIRL